MAKKTEIQKKKISATDSKKISGRPLRQPFFLASAFLLFVLMCWTYSNHFENPFEFDDAHTIVNNTAIRELKNIPRFFSDATTFSTLPSNQAWRPGVTTLNAIDYAVQHKMTEWAKKDSSGTAAGFQKRFCPKWMKQDQATKENTINPFYFHLSIFASYILLGFLLFFFALHIFKQAFLQINYSHWAALLATGFFLLHTANAETINYICLLYTSDAA